MEPKEDIKSIWTRLPKKSERRPRRGKPLVRSPPAGNSPPYMPSWQYTNSLIKI